MNKISTYTWRIILLPFSLVYGIVIAFRNILFDAGILSSTEFNLPVISVGNISTGGTGKTPHVEYLVELLKDNYKVATLSRGYKRKTRHFILAGTDSTVKEIGDEPVQIKQKYPEVQVAVDRKRVHGIQQLMEKVRDLDVILLDDAYQHRYVNPGLSILLIDFNRPITEDKLLPAGRLREQAYERRRANIILITKCPERLKPIERRLIVKTLKLYPFQHLFFTKLRYKEPVPVFMEENQPLNLKEIKASKPCILMVTGIVSPRLYKKHLRSISTRITEMTFCDHHIYTDKDILRIIQVFEELQGTDKLIFTTEKDAMKLRSFTTLPEPIKKRMFYVPVGIEFLNEETRNFNTQIQNYVRSNKRNSILHKQ